MRNLLFLLTLPLLLAGSCRLNQPTTDGLPPGTTVIGGRWPEPNIPLIVAKLGGGPALDTLVVGPAGSFRLEAPLQEPMILSLRGKEVTAAVLAVPGSRLSISPAVDFKGITFSPEDLANQIYQANNQGFLEDLSQRMGFILRAYPQQVSTLVDSLAEVRRRAVEGRRRELSPAATQLLLYEVQRRKHAFLFHYGKNIKQFSAKHVFFDFADDIDANDPIGLSSNLGLVVLQKWDILYRRPRRSMGTNRQFFDFLGDQYRDENAGRFYQSVYLRELLDGNALLAEHLEVLDVSDVASMEYHLGKANPYRYLYEGLLKRYYETRQGKRATDVTARDPQGKEVKLSDFDGKVIFIDSWASWCAPCMAELPYLHELAEAYRYEPDLVILTMSFDYNFNRWLEALNEQPAFPNIVPLFVEGGVDSDYAQNYLISSIPDYALLDRDRGIVTLDAPHPSEQEDLRRLIDRTLQNR